MISDKDERNELAAGDEVKVVKWRDGGATVELLFYGEVVPAAIGDLASAKKVRVKVTQANRGWKVGDVELVPIDSVIASGR